MSDHVVQVTFMIGDRTEALRVVNELVAVRLVACGQVDGPVRSVFRWQELVQGADEWRVVLKTTERRSAEVVSRVRAEHPDEVPEILVTPVIGGHPDYLAWVVDESEEPRLPDAE